MFLHSLMEDLVNNEKYIKENFIELRESDLGKFLFALNEYKQDVHNIDDGSLLGNKKLEFVNKYFDVYSSLTEVQSL
jgi:hypothetical protein